MLGIIFGFIAIIALDIFKHWLIYVHRGHAQPDDRSTKDHPIITDRDDALANRIVDLSASKKLKK